MFRNNVCDHAIFLRWFRNWLTETLKIQDKTEVSCFICSVFKLQVPLWGLCLGLHTAPSTVISEVRQLVCTRALEVKPGAKSIRLLSSLFVCSVITGSNSAESVQHFYSLRSHRDWGGGTVREHCWNRRRGAKMKVKGTEARLKQSKWNQMISSKSERCLHLKTSVWKLKSRSQESDISFWGR